MAILATEYAWARRWLRKVRRIVTGIVSGRHRRSTGIGIVRYRGEYEERAAQLAEDKAHKPDERLLIDPIRPTSGFLRAGKAGGCYRGFKEIETAIDNRYRNALIRQRIPMSTAPLVCQICKKSMSANSGMIAELIRPSLLEFTKKKMPNLDPRAFICFEDLGEFRKDYVKEVLEDEIGELTALDQEVVESLEQHEILSSDIIKQFERKLTFGERLSDRIAEFGGSWKFLITFGAVILVWIIINGITLATHAFDPYPFILLNLVLSCLAAVQAPVIMMSQNRSEARDRLRAENDYKVNLKAELEIRHLHEKLDHLLRRQYNRLFEIQQIQIELLQEIGRPKR